MRRNYTLAAIAALMLAATAHLHAQNNASGTGSAAISRVYEYRPAPGQFLNTMPEYEAGDTRGSILRKAEELLREGGTVSLGAFGGYIVFGFDHMVENRPGRYDLQVLGNSYMATGQTTGQGGSSEPAVVYVSYDANANGLPDDPWYELAGSEYAKAATRSCTVTYHRTPQDHVATPVAGTPVTDNTYIRWTDSEGGEGYLEMNAYHRQNYWPQWLSDEETLTFSGVRLAPNSVDVKGDGSYYVQTPYAWGYADNQPNDSTSSLLDLQWAVDAQGRPANLPGAHFVKVQTAVLQSNGWIGESSTEVAGALDLHLTGKDMPTATSRLALLTFEDTDYKGGDATDYWSALVDTPQYGGPLLYGEGGTGAYTEGEAYGWYDRGNTFLSSTVNNSWGAWAYWNGGIAVSDYAGSVLTGVTFMDQLTVYSPLAQDGRGHGGHDASDRFAVINGCDNSDHNGTDSRAVLTFGDGQPRVIDHAYVAPTTYFLSNMLHGGAYCTPAKEGTYVDLVAYGYDASGTNISTTALRLVDGTRHIGGWTWMDLSPLGPVHTVKFGFSVSADQIGDYGINTPTYVAIDDIAVRTGGTGTGIATLSPAPEGRGGRMYDLTGRQLRQPRRGQIVIKGGRKMAY